MRGAAFLLFIVFLFKMYFPFLFTRFVHPSKSSNFAAV